MRRSLAPSVLKSRLSGDGSLGLLPEHRSSINGNNANKSKSSSKEDEGGGGSTGDGETVTISRMPLFGFLEIPDALNKQFKIPSGCKITEKSLALRKVKTLGPSRRGDILRPGYIMAPLPKCNSQENSQNEDLDDAGEDLPTAVSNNIPSHEPLVLWTDPNNSEKKVEVTPELCYRLRPHQREGVSFLFECTMGLRGFDGRGCILADDMGLGKTFMSITLIWTLMNQGFQGESAIRKVIVACPTSLVGNWDREIKFWIDGKCETFPVKTEPKRIIKNFLSYRGKGVLIVSYETQRRYSKMFESEFKRYQSMNKTGGAAAGSGGASAEATDPLKAEYNGVCELLICDEAHKLKNADCALHVSLMKLPAKKRILLSGTPMQNELLEFYNLVNFCNPSILGSTADFKKRYERVILRARELDAPESDIKKASLAQKELSTIVNEFILKRGNILNAKHLPPKLVQYLTIPMTSLQEKMYDCVINSKEVRHIRDGKQSNTLNCIRQLINICNHPQLIYESYLEKLLNREKIEDDTAKLAQIFESEVKVVSNGNKKVLPALNPELSGKLFVLFRLMQTMKSLNTGEKIVIISNYTQTLDLIQSMCQNNKWTFCRLDGSTNATKRTKIVEDFNQTAKPSSGSASKYGSVNASTSTSASGAFAFLLSSKAGGCGINLIGANRLVLFDPDWNPASDKQAAGRVWREGQKRRCYLYRFMTQGTIEEKIIQRQISKEGLTNVVENTDPFATFDSNELKQLFVLNQWSRSDTHDTLRCKRCKTAKVESGSAAGGGGGAKKGEANQPLLTPSLIDLCVKFVDDFYQTVLGSNENKSAASHQKLVSYLEDLSAPKQKLQEQKYKTIPEFSREIRRIVMGIDGNISSSDVDNDIEKKEGGGGDMAIADAALSLSINVNDEFVQRWTEFVPTLSEARKQETKKALAAKNNKSSAADSDDEEEEEDEHQCVEQEGCPEESDLNRWSHHFSVNTCDDEILKKAFIDEATSAPTFIFGLEVNFQMLTENEELKKADNEKRKIELEDNLKELNETRKKNKLRASSGGDASESIASMGFLGLLGLDIVGGSESSLLDVQITGKKSSNGSNSSSSSSSSSSRKTEKVSKGNSMHTNLSDEENDDSRSKSKDVSKKEKESSKLSKSKEYKDKDRDKEAMDSEHVFSADISAAIAPALSRSGRVIQSTQRFDPLKIIPAMEEYKLDSFSTSSKPLSASKPINSGSLSRLSSLHGAGVSDDNGASTSSATNSATHVIPIGKQPVNRKSRVEIIEAENKMKIQNSLSTVAAAASMANRSRNNTSQNESIDIESSPLNMSSAKRFQEDSNKSNNSNNSNNSGNYQHKRIKVDEEEDEEEEFGRPRPSTKEARVLNLVDIPASNVNINSSGKNNSNSSHSGNQNKENQANSDFWPSSSDAEGSISSQKSIEAIAIENSANDVVVVSSDEWRCLFCTFVNCNKTSKICCAVCGEKRPRAISNISLKGTTKSILRR